MQFNLMHAVQGQSLESKVRTEPRFFGVRVGLLKWDKLRRDFSLICEGVDLLQMFEVMKSHNIQHM